MASSADTNSLSLSPPPKLPNLPLSSVGPSQLPPLRVVTAARITDQGKQYLTFTYDCALARGVVAVDVIHDLLKNARGSRW